MSYTALYRKFRPAAFEDVKGQEHIVTTLKNQIKAERTSHAYLFCGTRGTGKTTTTVNLGIGLANAGKRVLLVDADPQGDLTTSLGWPDQDNLSVTLATQMEKIIRDQREDE